MKIIDINDGVFAWGWDEYVEIRNDDIISFDVAQWTLSDADNNVYAFFPYTHILWIEPGDVIRVWTHCPPSALVCPYSYDSSQEIWDNTGDIATLRDEFGNIIDRFIYKQK